MKSTALLVALLACVSQAQAVQSCDELKTKIATKLDGKGVKAYTLEIVAADYAGDAKVVGNCEGGKKKLTYVRGKKKE